jgi:hypothetical protein
MGGREAGAKGRKGEGARGRFRDGERPSP